MSMLGTILVVEDNRDDFALLQLAFKRSGVAVEIRHVLDGSEAVRYLTGDDHYGDRSKNPLPHLILSDLKMPVMDGFELVKWVRQHAPSVHLPFVMLSSSNQTEDVRRAYQNCVNAYLFKPKTLGELAEIVGTLSVFWLRMNLRSS